jgi:GTPase
VTKTVTPIFLVSSVTGQNLDLFTSFLNLLPAVSDIRNNTEMNT